jgi:hypothetical protein
MDKNITPTMTDKKQTTTILDWATRLPTKKPEQFQDHDECPMEIGSTVQQLETERRRWRAAVCRREWLATRSSLLEQKRARKMRVIARKKERTKARRLKKELDSLVMEFIDSWWSRIEFEKEEGARGHKRRRNVSVQHGVWSKSLNEHLDMARKTKNNLDYGSTFSHLISPNTYMLEREVTRTDELSNTRDNVISNISQHVRDKLDIPPACTQAAAGIISTHCTAVHCEVCNDIFNNGIAGMENNIRRS